MSAEASSDSTPISPTDGPDPIPDLGAAVHAALAEGRDGVTHRFLHGEVPVTATIAPDDGGGFRVTLRAIVGVVPYGPEDAPNRKAFALAIGDIPLSDQACVGIDAHDVVYVEGAGALAAPLSSEAVVAAFADLMAALAPRFDALRALLPELVNALPASAT